MVGDGGVNKDNYMVVYLLGAGASAASDFNLPTMNDFFKKDFYEWRYPFLFKFIERYLRGRPLQSLNLEEVITFLELGIDKFGRFGEEIDIDLYKARYDFKNFIYDKLNYPAIDGRKWCSKYKGFLEHLRDKYSIITLNYDLILENTLREIEKDRPIESRILNSMNGLLESVTRLFDGDRPNICGEDRHRGYLLKLHGSINWFYCPNENCTHHQAFYTEPLEESIDFNLKGEVCKACGDLLAPVIIPPTMEKSFSEFPKLGFLWSIAYKKIKEARSLIIIGVSFAEADYYLRWLIKSAFNNKAHNSLCSISVVNKDKQIIDKVKYLTDPYEIKYYETLEEFVGNLNRIYL